MNLSERTSALLRETLDALQREFYKITKEAFEAGQETGETTGYSSGYHDGKEEGYGEGYQQGQEDAHNETVP